MTTPDIEAREAARIASAKRVAAAHRIANQSNERFIPHLPYGRQRLFLVTLKDKLEAFYGGAAGGMKSDSLLQAALEYVDVPYYAALILRRTYADLSLPGSLMNRAKEWLTGTSARWKDTEKTWVFPSKATLTFGYMDNEDDKFRYQSAEFQAILPDELTQFTETQYLYMFSRLRRPAIPCRFCRQPLTRLAGLWLHVEGSGEEIVCNGAEPDPAALKRNARLYEIPLRMRSASNPGGIGAEWVKSRFIPDDFTPDAADEERVWQKRGVDSDGKPFETWFVPARLKDNPFLDRVGYTESLDRLDKVTREQLLKGDWSISASGRMYFDFNAINRFTPKVPDIGELKLEENDLGDLLPMFLMRDNGLLARWRPPIRGRQYVMGCDTASGKDKNKGQGRVDADWSVTQVRDLETGEQVARFRAQIPERAFGDYNYRIGLYYNKAYCVPLVTGGYGTTMVGRMIDLGYPLHLFYCRYDEDKGVPKRTEDIGYIESTVDRPKLYSWLETAIQEHSIETYDAVTINEYRSFEINKDGKCEARAGCKDDCVAADGAAVVGIRRAPRQTVELLYKREDEGIDRYGLSQREQAAAAVYGDEGERWSRFRGRM